MGDINGRGRDFKEKAEDGIGGVGESSGRVGEYKGKVRDFNERVRDFNERVRDFNDRVRGFNAVSYTLIALPPIYTVGIPVFTVRLKKNH